MTRKTISLCPTVYSVEKGIQKKRYLDMFDMEEYQVFS